MSPHGRENRYADVLGRDPHRVTQWTELARRLAAEYA
jgi:DNA-binding transcriptional regulator YdaS (Cro superfamily)